MGHRITQISFLTLLLALSVFISAPSVAKNPATQPDDTTESFTGVEPLIGAPGVKHDGVLTFHIPRKDLEGRLFNELGDIPIAAGIEARFDFFKCHWLEVDVVDHIVVEQAEHNHVIHALRKTYYIKVVSIAPMMLGEKPRLQIIRFQGDGQAETLASYLKNALNQIGDARLAPATQP